MKYYTLDMNKL